MTKKIILIILMFLSGCFHKEGIYTREPKPLHKKYHYAIITKQSPPSVIYEERTEDYKIFTIGHNNSFLKFEYHKSYNNRNKNLIIIFNVLRDDNYTVAKVIKNGLVAEGYDCVIVHQPFFFKKKNIRPINKYSQGINPKNNTNSKTYDEYNTELAKNIQRLVKHWIPQQDLSGKFAFVGLSMGGIHSVLATAFNPNASCTIFMMAGGNNDKVLLKSTDDLVEHNMRKLKEYYRTELPQRDIKKDLRNTVFNLKELASTIDPKKVKQIISLLDTVVDDECQWWLNEQLGKPETVSYLAGHYTLAFYYFHIQYNIKRWLKEAFKS